MLVNLIATLATATASVVIVITSSVINWVFRSVCTTFSFHEKLLLFENAKNILHFAHLFVPLQRDC